jgi:hypothetical protein
LKRIRSITWIEFLIALALTALALRFVFATELLSFERRLFYRFGISESARVVIVLVGAFLVFYLNYRQGEYKERVPNWLMVCSLFFILFGLVAIAWLQVAA